MVGDRVKVLAALHVHCGEGHLPRHPCAMVPVGSGGSRDDLAGATQPLEGHVDFVDLVAVHGRNDAKPLHGPSKDSIATQATWATEDKGSHSVQTSSYRRAWANSNSQTLS